MELTYVMDSKIVLESTPSENEINQRVVVT